MKEFDPESIAEFDGKDGKPVYVVHRGRVFDVSESKLWKGGLHMKRHHAGKDMTTDIQAAPHGPESSKDTLRWEWSERRRLRKNPENPRDS